jgi:hypothetical protein
VPDYDWMEYGEIARERKKERPNRLETIIISLFNPLDLLLETCLSFPQSVSVCAPFFLSLTSHPAH